MMKADEVWYPPDFFLITIHDIIIEQFDGWNGFESGIQPYHEFVEEAKKARNLQKSFSIA